MTDQTPVETEGATTAHRERAGLALLREPFPEHQVSKLPKATKAQNEAVKRDFKQGIRCDICGGWHHPKVVHLDYVGHAALTDRLLECDPLWNWEPVATTEHGTPQLDANGGMWIRLTVCNVTRLGYGHPDGKQGGDAIKETIGDALRNAAMRFGAALDLWHKGVLHGVEEPTQDEPATAAHAEPAFDAPAMRDRLKAAIAKAADFDALDALWGHPKTAETFKRLHPAMQSEVVKAYEARKAELDDNRQEEAAREPGPGHEPTPNHPHRNADIGGDEIPY